MRALYSEPFVGWPPLPGWWQRLEESEAFSHYGMLGLGGAYLAIGFVALVGSHTGLQTREG